MSENIEEDSNRESFTKFEMVGRSIDDNKVVQVMIDCGIVILAIDRDEALKIKEWFKL